MANWESSQVSWLATPGLIKAVSAELLCVYAATLKALTDVNSVTRVGSAAVQVENWLKCTVYVSAVMPA